MPDRSTAFLLLLALVACGTHAVRVTDVWFDRAADFASMRTYSVRPIATSVDVTESLATDVETAIRRYLDGRGYRQVEGDPDFVVVTELEAADIVDSARVSRRAAATVTMTMLAGGDRREVWRADGSAEAPDRTLGRSDRIRETVDLMLRRFPPKPED